MTLALPDALPVLSAGHHPWGSGKDRAPVDELEAKRLNVRLAVWSARSVLPLVLAEDLAVCTEAIESAERWVAHPSEAAANAAAYAYAAADAAADAAYAAADAAYANAANAAAYAAAYAAANANAANAANAAAADAAYAAADATADAATAADAAADAARLASLDALITEYDRLVEEAAPHIDIPWEQMTNALGRV